LGIVRGHNGALLVDSEVGRGTTFRLFLPPIYGETPVEPATPTVTVDAWRSSGDVLIIEDEEPVREMVTRMVRTFGFAPHPVSDGANAVATFRANPKRWELAVVDLVMPGMDGEQTLRELRLIQEDVRVLLISGYAEGDVLSRVQGDSRVVFLAKPFKREAFEAKLRELFA
jgi:DNA-binding response OmpR family regulator